MGWNIWMKLPQVSSKTASVTIPGFVGSVLNTTPSAFIRSYSREISSTINAASWMPAAYRDLGYSV